MRRWLRNILWAGLLLALLLPSQPQIVLSETVRPPFEELTPSGGATWRYNYILVTLQPGTDLSAARGLLEDAGMRVGLVFPPSCALGWAADPDAVARVPGVAAVHSGLIDPAPGTATEPGVLLAEQFYNAVMSDSIQWDAPVRENLEPLSGEARTASGIDAQGIRANLLDQGIEADAGVLTTGTSDVMVGSVTVNLFLIESDGTIDPNLYTWTDLDVQQTLSRVGAALSWWSAMAAVRGVPLTFYVNAYLPTDPRCQTGYEPIRHSSNDAALWIDGTLTRFGYRVGGFLTKAAAFNAWSRSQFKTDWAYSVFVEYNPSPARDRFIDGYSAWAYTGGPLVNALFRSFGWPLDRSLAHETGHIFGACDEYYQVGYGGCGGCTVCRHDIPNANCALCNQNPAPCVMLDNRWSLCDYTQGHVGWGLPPGLICSDATAVTLGETVSGTTSGRLNNQSMYGGVLNNESGPEVVYRLTLAQRTTFTATLSGLVSNLDVVVLSGCSADAFVTFGENRAVVKDAAAGTYLIVVDGVDGAVGPYTLTISGAYPERTLSVAVKDGWNLVALPVLSEQVPVTEALASLAGRYDGVFAFDPSNAEEPWKAFLAGDVPVRSLDALDGKTAFWVHCTAPGVIQAKGRGPQDTAIMLRQGWNLVPYGGLSSRPVAQALGNVASLVDRIYQYDATLENPWRRFSRSAPAFANQVTELVPGKGYWILSKAQCIWVPPD